MNYYYFQKNLIEDLKKQIPNAVIKTAQILKQNNQLIDYVQIHYSGNPVAPSIPLNDLFNRYNNGESYEDILKNIVESQLQDNIPDVANAFNKIAYENLTLEVLNYDKNLELLKNVPHEKFLDLALVTRYRVPSVENGTVLVTNDFLANALNLTKQELFFKAKENLKNATKDIRSMEDIMRGYFVSEGFPEEELDDLFQSPTMYVMSSGSSYGASIILDNESLDYVSKKLHDDLLIIPSSIHEIIVVPASSISPDWLDKTIADVNASTLDPLDQLSDNAYHYNAKTHTLTIASAMVQQNEASADVQKEQHTKAMAM